MLHPTQRAYKKVPKPIKKHLTTIITAALVASLFSNWGQEHITVPAWNNTAVPAYDLTSRASRATWNHTAVPAWNYTAVPAWRLTQRVVEYIDKITANQLVPIREYREEKARRAAEAQTAAEQLRSREQLAAAALARQHRDEGQAAIQAATIEEQNRYLNLMENRITTPETLAAELALRNFATQGQLEEHYVTTAELNRRDYQDETQVRNTVRALLPAQPVQQ